MPKRATSVKGSNGISPAGCDLITSTSADVPISVPTVSEPSRPNFNFWITEAVQLTDAETPDNFGALFCAKKAEATAGSDIEWGRAKNSLGAAQFRLNNLNEALAAFREIGNRFNSASEADKQIRLATALLNEGLTLVHLGRQEEGIAVLDDIVARFGSALELTLRERVGGALLNRGAARTRPTRTQGGIIVLYDDVRRARIPPSCFRAFCCGDAWKVRAARLANDSPRRIRSCAGLALSRSRA